VDAPFPGVVGSLIDLRQVEGFIEFFYNGQVQQGPAAKLSASLDAGGLATMHEMISSRCPNRNYVLVNFQKEYREKYTLSLSVLAAGRCPPQDGEVWWLSGVTRSGRLYAQYGKS
jgi:hypothetical protein